MRSLAGHLCHHLGLFPPALAILDEVFLEGFQPDAMSVIDAALEAELGTARAFCFLLGRPAAPRVCCSDASSDGYALHKAAATARGVLDSVAWKER